MIRTAKEWAELFTKLAEADPNQLVWAYLYDKAEVGYTFDNDTFIPNDEHWEKIVNDIGSDYAFDTLHETFTDAIYRTLGDFRCEDCYSYDYEVKDLDGTKTCQNCGEEEDNLSPK